MRLLSGQSRLRIPRSLDRREDATSPKRKVSCLGNGRHNVGEAPRASYFVVGGAHRGCSPQNFMSRCAVSQSLSRINSRSCTALPRASLKSLFLSQSVRSSVSKAALAILRRSSAHLERRSTSSQDTTGRPLMAQAYGRSRGIPALLHRLRVRFSLPDSGSGDRRAGCKGRPLIILRFPGVAPGQ